MSANASATVSLSYRPPGATANITPSTTVLAPYNAQSDGTIDISAGTVSGTQFSVAFGSVASPTGVLVSNTGNSTEVAIWAQGLSNTPFNLPAGGVFLLAQPVSCTAVPLSGLKVVTTVAQVTAGTIDFVILGDP